VRGPGEVRPVVDVAEVDADERGPLRDEQAAGVGREVGGGSPVGGRAPAGVPVSSDEHRPAGERQAREGVGADGRRPPPSVDHQTRQVGVALEGQRGQVGLAGVAVGRRVDVGADARDHLQPGQLEGDAGRVVGGQLLARGERPDRRPRNARVGGHAVFERVAQVDEPAHSVRLAHANSRRNWRAPLRSGGRLSRKSSNDSGRALYGTCPAASVLSWRRQTSWSLQGVSTFPKHIERSCPLPVTITRSPGRASPRAKAMARSRFGTAQ